MQNNCTKRPPNDEGSETNSNSPLQSQTFGIDHRLASCQAEKGTVLIVFDDLHVTAANALPHKSTDSSDECGWCSNKHIYCDRVYIWAVCILCSFVYYIDPTITARLITFLVMWWDHFIKVMIIVLHTYNDIVCILLVTTLFVLWILIHQC